MTRPSRLSLFLVVAVLATGPACRQRGATAEECHEIFGRLVTLEMEELGFRDPIAVHRTKERLRRDMAVSIAACEGSPLKASALTCVRQARRAEEITHVCLE
jgi:hypothetical protein